MNAAAAGVHLRQPHPSPHRGRVRYWSLWFAILAAPLAWSLQLLINAGLAAHGCYPNDVPLAAPLWGHLNTVSAIVETIALVICVGAGIAAGHNWSRSRGEKPGGAQDVIAAGNGRTRFMAMVAMMTSGLFLLATGISAWNLLVVPACGG